MTTDHLERTRRRELLERRVRESGLSVRQFATDVLVSDERTVRRWLKDEQQVSNVVTDFLENPRPRPWPAPIASDALRTELDHLLDVIGWDGYIRPEETRAGLVYDGLIPYTIRRIIARLGGEDPDA